MDEFTLYKYLMDKERYSMSDHDFTRKFKHFMNKYRRNSMRSDEDNHFIPTDDEDFYMKRNDNLSQLDRLNYNRMDSADSSYHNKDMYKMMRYMRNSMMEEGINDSDARHIVSRMYHIENGKRYVGEKYDMHKAKEVCEHYKDMLPSYVRHTDVYMAINSQYHTYAELFKNWFGNTIDQKIIDSAIVFWFKDMNYKGDNKVIEYLDD